MTSDSTENYLFEERIATLETEKAELQESMDEVRRMMDYEDKGWTVLGNYFLGNKDDSGLDLDELKSVSEKARVRVAASSLDKRAVDLHTGFVFGKGLDFEGTHREEGKRGQTPALVTFFNKPRNRESVFSPTAWKELQKARFCDGLVLVLCNTVNKTVDRVPLDQITGYIQDPDFPEHVTAWKRTWKPNPKDKESKERYYYTARHEGPKKPSIEETPGHSVPVEKGVIAVDLRVNRQTGWSLGVPDAVAGMLWAEAYGQVLTYGQVVNESLSKIIYKVTNNTKKGVQSTAVKIAGATGHGNAASMAEGQDIQLVNSSMRSFDFAAARPLAAMAASAWNVSNMDLLSDSSAAGSSYGSAQALTSGIRNAMLGIRADWGEFFRSIFDVFGFNPPKMQWAPIDDPDPYRKAQELKLLSDALSDEEYRGMVLDQLNMAGDPSDVPPLLASRNVLLDTNATGVQQASPNQGKSNGAGNAGSTDSNDIQNDTIGEGLLNRMQLESLIERIENVSHRLSENGL